MEIAIKQLESEKSISVTQSYVNKANSQYTFLAYDKDRQFSVRIFSLNPQDNQDLGNDLLSQAKQFAQNLKDCHHENILKYIDEFQIDNHYYILMERFEMNLVDWLHENRLKVKINRNLFLKLALSLFNSLQYLHSKNLLLQNLTPKDIYLNKDNSAKICDFDSPQEVIPSEATKKFLAFKTTTQEYFLPPELLDYSKNQNSKLTKVLQEKEGDIWVIAMCLYSLTGISLVFIKRFTKGTGFFQYQEKLDFDISQFLMNIFWLNPKLRPPVSDIIESIQKLQIVQIEQIVDQEYKPEFIELLNQGKDLYSNEQFQESIEVLKKAEEIEPQLTSLLNLIGNAYYETKEYEQANKYLQLSLQYNPQNSLTYKCLGHSYLNLKQLEEAVTYLKKSIELNPEYSHAYNVLGVCLERQQKEDEAIEFYKISHNLHPQQSLPSCNLGYLYQRKQNYEESIYWLKKSIEINPNNYDAIIQLSFVYYNESKFEDALIYCQKSLEIDPLKEEPLQNIERYDEAVKCLKKAIKLCENIEYMYFTLAYAYLQQLQYQKGVYCLKKQIKIDKINLEAYGILGDQYLFEKKYDKIIKNRKNYQADDLFLDQVLSAKCSI